jgi:putative oxidoreductase
MNMDASKKCVNWGLLALRLAVGVVFIYHGWMKLNGMEGTVGMMASIGLPVASFWAWLVALVEFGGGIAIILGLFNRVVTALLSITMVVALLTIHTKMPYGGATELPIVLLGALLALHTTGAGKFAVMGKSAECDCGKSEDECCGGGCGHEHEEEKK